MITFLIALIALAVISLGVFCRRRPRNSQVSATGQAVAGRSPIDKDTAGAALPAARDLPEFSTSATDALAMRSDALAFGTGSLDEPLDKTHVAVLERIGQSIATAIHQRDYFPRRPLLLPRLLRTLNDSESTRKDVVRLLLEDPALAGSVLQRANSAYYRPSPMPIDSLDAAVRALGSDGLRGLIANVILQPVFRLPEGSFKEFAQITWEQAQRSARAAEVGARASAGTDPFVAQLLGLLKPLARIVLFRLAMDLYRAHPEVSPSAGVLATAMRRHAPLVARLIASSWELPDPSIMALEEQLRGHSPLGMSALGRCLYYGNLCGAAAMLGARDALASDEGEALLAAQGMPQDAARGMLQAALSAVD